MVIGSRGGSGKSFGLNIFGDPLLDGVRDSGVSIVCVGNIYGSSIMWGPF